MNKIFSKISQISILLLIFLLPIFLLPLFPEIITFPKISLFFLVSLLVFFLWTINQLWQKEIELKDNLFLYPLFLISLANIVSLIVNLNHSDKFNSFWNSLPFLILPLFFWLFVQFFSPGKRGLIEVLLMIPAVIIAGLGIFLFLLPTSFYPLTFNFLGNPLTISNFGFSPTGTNLVSLFFLTSLIPFIIKKFAGFFAEEKDQRIYLKVTFWGLISLIILTAIGIFFFQAVSVGPSQGGIINLPYSTGWVIAVETFKNPLSALFGVGPGNFLAAFTKFKPSNFNLTNFWNFRFASSANELFQIITTLGLFGLATYLYLFSQLLKQSSSSGFWPAMILFFSMFILPFNFLLYFLLTLYLSLIALEKSKNDIKIYRLNTRSSFVFAISIFLLIILSFYCLGRGLLAEYYLAQSIRAVNENRAVDTYNLQIKAISFNPYKANYHQLFSQTNLALANSLATQKDLSDQDKARITQLVQQSIREARNATVLAQENVNYWENLAAIYRQLVNFAQGAESWAINSLNQALNLDPFNPQLYLNLGGIHYFFGRYDEAITFFQTSVNLKPNFANGWYNLASAYKQKKEYPKAFNAFNQVLPLVQVNSLDYQKIQEEIEQIKEYLGKLPEQKPVSDEETLTLPQPPLQPTAKITPIELPEAE